MPGVWSRDLVDSESMSTRPNQPGPLTQFLHAWRTPSTCFFCVCIIACTPKTNLDTTNTANAAVTSGSPETTESSSLSSFSPTGEDESSSYLMTGGATDGLPSDVTDLPSDLPACDPYMPMSCPEGEKCVWLDGLDIDKAQLACVPEARQPIPPWQPCPPNEDYTGIDDCASGTMCLPFGTLDDSWACTPHCKWDGVSEGAVCGAKEICVYSETWAWCKKLCSPFAQDCPIDEVCAVDGQATTCFSKQDGPFSKLAGESCDSEYSCAPSLLCVYAESLQGCAGEACCTPLCSISEDVGCPSPDLQCLPITVDDEPSFWPGLGVCVSEAP